VNSDVLNRQNPVGATSPGTRRAPWLILGTICALVIGFFAWSARPGWLGMRTWRAEDAYYNQLVRGFRAGQLDLKTEVPAGLAQLADPYDPVANAGYLLVDGHPLWDLSYYHGKLYFYFGLTPALVLFWPYAVLTGHYLGHKDAVVVFCAIGFLASVGLLCALWRRYFPEVGVAVVAAGTLALGLADFTPVILPRAEIYEVAIGCSYALAMLALLALWRACHRPQQRGRWLAVASLAYGLAIGARPTALFGAVILLVPVVQAWCEGRRIWVALLAATGPITCIGLGLILYNALRFGNPFEFGAYYQLNDLRTSAQHLWSLHYLKANFWDYFLAPAHGRDLFPFIHDLKLPPLSKAECYPEHPFGVLTSIPLVWLALAAPLAWRGRSADVRSILRGFLVAVALLFAARALILGPYAFAFIRYEWEFCPLLVLLAVAGIFGLERALAGRPAWRWAARGAWGLLLAFSLSFNFLASVIYHAEYHSKLGSLLVERGQVNEGMAHYQKALVLQPDDAATHYNLGIALAKTGQMDEAIRQYQEALRLKPDYAEAHNNLGGALGMKGQTDEAIHQFQETLRLKPEQADAHFNLAAALSQKGQTDEAIRQLQETLRLKPDYVLAHNNLGSALYQRGRTGEAIREFQEALGLKPDYAEARKNLIIALAAQSSPAPPPGVSTNR
jgi:Flp pilus assembly protein TadD